MTARTGEKTGWIAGWLGSFCWVGILCPVFLFLEQPAAALAGAALFAAGILGAFLLSPWRHPDTPYWKLMLPLYANVVLCMVWAVCSFGGASAGRTPWGTLALIIPVALPLFTMGRRTWNAPQPGTAGGADRS